LRFTETLLWRRRQPDAVRKAYERLYDRGEGGAAPVAEALGRRCSMRARSRQGTTVGVRSDDRSMTDAFGGRRLYERLAR
jgi:hypothetical protein